MPVEQRLFRLSSLGMHRYFWMHRSRCGVMPFCLLQRRLRLTLFELPLLLIPLRVSAQAGIEYAARSEAIVIKENGFEPIAGCYVGRGFVKCLVDTHPFGLTIVMGVLLLGVIWRSFHRQV